MRPYLVIIIIVFSTVSHGAYFEYYAGGLRAFSEVYTEDETYYDGPYSDTNDSSLSAMAEEYAEVPNANSYSANSIWDANDRQKHSACIRIKSFTDVLGDNNECYGYGYGYGGTQSGTTYGIYYKIMPDQNEAVGDDVIVFGVCTMRVEADGPTYAYIGGPADMNYMAVTKGQLPPVTSEPNSKTVVWKLNNQELSNGGFDQYSSIAPFAAKVGDVVGIFAENYTDITCTGYSSGLIESQVTIVLTAKTVLLGDLDDNGTVNFGDFAIFADNWLERIN